MKSWLDDETKKKDEGGPSSYTPLSELPDEDPNKRNAPDYYVPERCSVLEQLRISIMSPKQLIGLSQLKVSRFVKYVLIIGFLVIIMTYIVPTAATLAGFGGFHKLFEEKMPNFTVQNATLTAESRFSVNLGNYEILMDTEEDTVSQDKFLGKLVTVAIGKKRVQVVVSQSGLNEVAVDQPISYLFEDGFTRQNLVDAIPGFYIALGLVGLFSMAGVIVKYLIASLLYMILAWGLAKQSDLGLTKGNIFRLCFYAQTIGILLVNLNEALGFLIPSLIVSAVGIFISIRWVAKSLGPYLFQKGQTPA